MEHRDIYIPGNKSWNKKQQFKGNKGTWLPYFPGPSVTPFMELHKPTLRFKELIKETVGAPLYFVYRNYLYYTEQLSGANITIEPSSGFSIGYSPIPPDADLHFAFLPPTEGFPFLRFGKVRHVTIGQDGDYVECHTAAISGAVLYFCKDQKHLFKCVMASHIVIESTITEIEGYFNDYINPNDKRCMRLFPIAGGLVSVERYRIKSGEHPNGKVPHETILTQEAKSNGIVPDAVLAWQTYWWDVDAYPIQCTEQQEFLSVYAIAGSAITEVDSLGELGTDIKKVAVSCSCSGDEAQSKYAQTIYHAIEGDVSIGSGAELIGESEEFKVSVYSSMISWGGFVLHNCDGVGKVFQSSSEGYQHVGFYRIEDNYGDDIYPGHSMTDIANLVQRI